MFEERIEQRRKVPGVYCKIVGSRERHGGFPRWLGLSVVEASFGGKTGARHAPNHGGLFIPDTNQTTWWESKLAWTKRAMAIGHWCLGER